MLGMKTLEETDSERPDVLTPSQRAIYDAGGRYLDGPFVEPIGPIATLEKSRFDVRVVEIPAVTQVLSIIEAALKIIAFEPRYDGDRDETVCVYCGYGDTEDGPVHDDECQWLLLSQAVNDAGFLPGSATGRV